MLKTLNALYLKQKIKQLLSADTIKMSLKFGDKEVDKKEFIEMINNIDFLYGFIYECANLVNNLDDYDNYNHLSVKLCNKFIIPIINITKKEHIKEYNEHIKNIIDNLESIKDIYSICSYLMNRNLMNNESQDEI